MSVLTSAILTCNYDKVKSLLDDPRTSHLLQTKDQFGFTPLDHAEDTGDDRMIQLIRNELRLCVLCGKDRGRYGNNAQPVAEGKCCDDCNATIVIPLRLAMC